MISLSKRLLVGFIEGLRGPHLYWTKHIIVQYILNQHTHKDSFLFGECYILKQPPKRFSQPKGASWMGYAAGS